MSTTEDAAHASVRVAESVVALARAEIHLALTSARATGEQLVLTLVLSAVALLLMQVAFVVLVLSPILWTLRPAPTLVASALAFSGATISSLLALRRWRALGPSRFPLAPHHAAVSDPERT